MSMYAYSLTGLTGRKKNVNRTVIVATVEVNRFTFAVAIASLVVSLIPTIAIGLLLGPYWYYGMFIPAVFVAAGLFLIDQRSKGGLRLRRYQALNESRQGKKTADVIVVCGRPLEEPVMGRIIPQFIDAAPENTTAAALGTDIRTRNEKADFLHA